MDDSEGLGSVLDRGSGLFASGIYFGDDVPVGVFGVHVVSESHGEGKLQL